MFYPGHVSAQNISGLSTQLGSGPAEKNIYPYWIKQHLILENGLEYLSMDGRHFSRISPLKRSSPEITYQHLQSGPIEIIWQKNIEQELISRKYGFAPQKIQGLADNGFIMMMMGFSSGLFLRRYDAEGNEQWQHNDAPLGGELKYDYYPTGFSLQITPRGDIRIDGKFGLEAGVAFPSSYWWPYSAEFNSGGVLVKESIRNKGDSYPLIYSGSSWGYSLLPDNRMVFVHDTARNKNLLTLWNKDFTSVKSIPYMQNMFPDTMIFGAYLAGVFSDSRLLCIGRLRRLQDNKVLERSIFVMDTNGVVDLMMKQDANIPWSSFCIISDSQFIGTYRGYDDKTRKNFNGIACFDRKGVKLWDKPFIIEKDYSVTFTGCQKVKDGFLLHGSILREGTGEHIVTGIDAIVAKFSSTGELQWYHITGKPGIDDYMRASAELSNGDIVAAGETMGEPFILRLRPGALTVQSTAEIWPAIYALYPQPSDKGFYISGGAGDLSIRISDMMGRTAMYCGTISSGSFIATEGLSSGLYSVEIKSDKSIERRKLLIKHD
jgi:hypothetical protein